MSLLRPAEGPEGVGCGGRQVSDIQRTLACYQHLGHALDTLDRYRPRYSWAQHYTAARYRLGDPDFSDLGPSSELDKLGTPALYYSIAVPTHHCSVLFFSCLLSLRIYIAFVYSCIPVYSFRDLGPYSISLLRAPCHRVTIATLVARHRSTPRRILGIRLAAPRHRFTPHDSWSTRADETLVAKRPIRVLRSPRTSLGYRCGSFLFSSLHPNPPRSALPCRQLIV